MFIYDKHLIQYSGLFQDLLLRVRRLPIYMVFYFHFDMHSYVKKNFRWRSPSLLYQVLYRTYLSYHSTIWYAPLTIVTTAASSTAINVVNQCVNNVEMNIR